MNELLKLFRWSVIAASFFLLLLSPRASAQEPPPTKAPAPSANEAPSEEKATDPTGNARPATAWQQRLSASQKLVYGAGTTYLNPGTYIGPSFRSYFTQRNELPVPGKTRGDNFADGMSFYARYFALQSTANFLASGVYPVLFRQDPRYYPSPKRSFGARLLYASTRTFLTRSDGGRPQYNYSKLAGFMTSAALANTYEKNTPRTIDAQGRVNSYTRRTGTAATFRNVGILLASDIIGNVLFNEFRLGDKMAIGFKRMFGK